MQVEQTRYPSEIISDIHQEQVIQMMPESHGHFKKEQEVPDGGGWGVPGNIQNIFFNGDATCISWPLDDDIRAKFGLTNPNRTMLEITDDPEYEEDDDLDLPLCYIILGTDIKLHQDDVYALIKYYLDRDDTYPFIDGHQLSHNNLCFCTACMGF